MILTCVADDGKGIWGVIIHSAMWGNRGAVTQMRSRGTNGHRYLQRHGLNGHEREEMVLTWPLSPDGHLRCACRSASARVGCQRHLTTVDDERRFHTNIDFFSSCVTINGSQIHLIPIRLRWHWALRASERAAVERVGQDNFGGAQDYQDLNFALNVQNLQTIYA
jgi:hypothetical protein